MIGYSLFGCSARLTPSVRIGSAEHAGCIGHTGGGKQRNGNESKFHDLSPTLHFMPMA